MVSKNNPTNFEYFVVNIERPNTHTILIVYCAAELKSTLERYVEQSGWKAYGDVKIGYSSLKEARRAKNFEAFKNEGYRLIDGVRFLGPKKGTLDDKI